MNLSRGFQFPLHRDPRCNSNEKARVTEYLQFQFPLHRDPRCNADSERILCLGNSKGFSSLYIGILAATRRHHIERLLHVVSVPFTSGSSLQPQRVCVRSGRKAVSVPFTSGSSLQHNRCRPNIHKSPFQFPLHRDPRCNQTGQTPSAMKFIVSVPFTSGSSLQLSCNEGGDIFDLMFQFPLHRDPRCNQTARYSAHRSQ